MWSIGITAIEMAESQPRKYQLPAKFYNKKQTNKQNLRTTDELHGL